MTEVHPAAGGSRHVGPVAWLRAYRRDPLALISSLASGRDLSRVRPGRHDIFVINSPELIRQVVASGDSALEKGATIRASRRLLGAGLLSSEGELHTRQRRLLQPAFHRREHGRFAEAAVLAVNRRQERWENGAKIDLSLEARHIVISVLGRSLFSTGMETMAADILPSVGQLQQVARNVGFPGGELLQRLPLPYGRRMTRAYDRLDEVIASIIGRRRREMAAGDLAERDFLSILLDPEAPGGETQARDEAMTMMVAGHETTASMLGWCGWLLATHPAEQARLSAEIDGALAGQSPTVEDLERVPRLRAVLSETLRLYPPIWAFSRLTTEPYALDGTAVEAGSVLLVSPYVTQRDERFFADPHSFKPERWLGEWKPGRFEYFPFGGGPRMCIGEGFAWTVGQIVLATIAAQWEMRPAGAAPKREPLVTLRPGGGVPVTLHRRRQA